MEISSRIIKGGALLEDSQRFVELWDESRSADENLEDFRIRNLLGKRSRSRAEDTIAILRQRFVEPGPEIVKALRPLIVHGAAFRDACYYEAARNDPLLAHVANNILYGLRDRGRAKITVDGIDRALVSDPPAPIVATWADQTRIRVVHGLMSALRDFGVLDGKVNKYVASPRISLGGFVYVLGRLRDGHSSSHEIVTSPIWRWWLLEDRQIRGYLLEADREGVIRFSDAGSIVRIDWSVDGLEEMIRAVA
jgi:hypothetical protein